MDHTDRDYFESTADPDAITSKMSLSTGEIAADDTDLEEVPLEDLAHNLSHSALFKALSELTEEEESGTDSVLREPQFSKLSQHSIEQSSRTIDAEKPGQLIDNLTDTTDHIIDNTDYLEQTPLQSHLFTPLSQYPIIDDTGFGTNSTPPGLCTDLLTKASDSSEARTSTSPDYGMCSTRPGTVIERPGKSDNSVPQIAVNEAIESHFLDVNQFDNGSHRISIGDTLIHYEKPPISASTPLQQRGVSYTDPDTAGIDSGRPSSPISEEISSKEDKRARSSSKPQYMSLEERDGLLKDFTPDESSRSSGILADRKNSSEFSGNTRKSIDDLTTEEIFSQHSASSRTSIGDDNRSLAGSQRSIGSSHSSMLGGSQVRSSLSRESVGTTLEGDVLSPYTSPKVTQPESSSGGVLVRAAHSRNSSVHSSIDRVSIGSVDRFKTGSPIDDVHVEKTPVASHSTPTDRSSIGSIQSTSGKISIGRASGASSLASEVLDKKLASSVGSSTSAKLLLDEMYMASRKTSSNLGSNSTGTLSDISSRHSSKAPSERLSNASSLVALSEHIEPGPDSARSHDSGTGTIPVVHDPSEEDANACESAGDSASLSERVAALLSEAVPREAEGDDEGHRRIYAAISETGSNLSNRRSSTESEQDMAKISTQYSALLRSDLASTGPFGSMESLEEDQGTTAPAVERLRPAPVADHVEITSIVRDDGEVQHLAGSVDLNSSMESEDALDRDVRRILAKYGRSLSDSEDESERKATLSPLVSLDSMGEKINTLLKSQHATDAISEGVNTLTLAGTTNLPNYLFDDPGRSMSLPFDATSNVSEETPHHTQTNFTLQPSSKDQRQQPLPPVQVKTKMYSNGGRKQDDLEHRVHQLLEVTDHLGEGKAMSIQTDSDRQSIASSLDYRALARDLDDIQSNLESLKSDSDTEQNSRRSSQVSQPSAAHPANSAYTSEYSTPKKYNWDHGGDVGAAVVEDEPRKWTEMPTDRQKLLTGDMGPNPLLTSGVVPFDVALDIMHGSGASPQRRYQQTDVQDNHLRTELDDVDEGDREVAAFNASDGNAEHDTSNQISDILEKDTSHQQDYKYIQDSEDNESINIGIGPRLIRYEAPSTAAQESPGNLTSGSYSLNMSPLKPHQPFNTFGRLGSMFTTQVDKVSHSHFDQSVELRSPMKRNMQSDINEGYSQRPPRFSPNSYETEDIDRILARRTSPKLSAKSHEDLRYKYRDLDETSPSRANTSGRSYEQDLHGRLSQEREHFLNYPKDHSFEQKANMSRSQENLPTSAHREMVHNRKTLDPYYTDVLERMRSPVAGSPGLTERAGRELESRRSPSLRLSPDATKEGLKQDVNWLQNLGNRSERTAERVAASHSPRSQSPVSRGGEYRSQSPVSRDRDYRSQSPVSRDRDYRSQSPVNRDRDYRSLSPTTRDREYSSPRNVETGYLADLEVRHKDGKSDRHDFHSDLHISKPETLTTPLRRETNRPNLTPYKPLGGNTLYYVDMTDRDDCAQSVAMSETTVESTHPGSDDARGPTFPSSILGSRSDPSSSDSQGMYTKPKHASAKPADLVTIQEQPSHLSSDEREFEKRASDSSGKTKKSDEKEVSFTRTRDWINGNFIDHAKEDEFRPLERTSDAYLADHYRSSRDDYLREDPAIADALRKYRPRIDTDPITAGQSLPRDSAESYPRSDGLSAYTRERLRDSLPISSQKESSGSRRTTAETLDDVLSPMRAIKPAPITSPIHFSTPQKYGSSKLSGDTPEPPSRRRIIETTPKEHTLSSIVRVDEPKPQKTVDEICAEYTSKFHKYDYTDILTDMKSPAVTGKEESYLKDQPAREDMLSDYKSGYAPLYPDIPDPTIGVTDNSRDTGNPVAERYDVDYREPRYHPVSVDKYAPESRDVYHEEGPIHEEREEGYHPYIPDTKYHRPRPPPVRNSLLRDRERAELENSLLRDRQLTTRPEDIERIRNQEYIEMKLSPDRHPPQEKLDHHVGVDYRNSYSPDKYGTYKSYNDLVAGEYDTLTKEYEERAIETRDIERAQAEGVIKPSLEFQSSSATDVLGRLLDKDVGFVDRHTEDYTSFKRDEPTTKYDCPPSNGAEPENRRQFSPLYPDQDNDEEDGRYKPEYKYTLYDTDRSRSPTSYSRHATSGARGGSPITSRPPLPGDFSRLPLSAAVRQPESRRRSPSPRRTPSPRSAVLVGRYREAGDHYQPRSYSPARSRSPGRAASGLDDTDTLLKEATSISEDRGPSRLSRASGQSQSKSQRRMLELMARQSPGLDYVPRSAQDAWERLQNRKNNTRSEGNTTASSLDISRLSSLLKNPAQHYMHSVDLTDSDQASIMSEEDSRLKMREISDKLKKFTEPKKSGAKSRSRGGGQKESGDGGQNQKQNGESSTQKSSSNGKESESKPIQRQSGGSGNGGRDNGDDQGKKPPKTTSFADDKDDTESEDVSMETTAKDDDSENKSARDAATSPSVKPKKMAWVITDETLQSVPEDSTLDSVSSDFTTCSSVESDGKVVTRTSKRHLPADPKLLKLQQKIAKQKVRYERDHYRELKRKEKINKLEEMLRQKGRTLRSGAKKGERSGRVTSTPASARYVSSTSGSSSLTVSDITTSTLTGTTFSSEGSTTLRESSPERSTLMSSTMPSEQSTECACAHESPKKRRQPSPKKHKQSESVSPSRRKRIREVSKPKDLKLQEVDWSREESQDDTSHSYYGPPANSGKRNNKHKSPSRRDKENERLRKRAKEDSNRAVKKSSSKHRHKSPGGPRTREFGATCPTPTSVTPPRQHSATRGDVAVQTGAEDASFQATVPSYFKGRSKHPGMFTPEMGNTPRVNYRGEKLTVKAGPCGMAWFVPMDQTKPWRKPLKERQAYSETIETGLERGDKMDPLTYGMDGLQTVEDAMEPEIYLGRSNSIPPEERHPFDHHKVSLQEAFIRNKAGFISRSRERERHVLLRAEERRIQELHQEEREKMFAGEDRRAPVYHPLGERHFEAKKRSISRKEMLAITRKKYEDLPEIKRQREEKKKQEEFKTNRVRANLFKKRVQNKVLNKAGPWLEV